jgi:hypothetical protein
MSEQGRNARFVRTAKTLLLFQVGAAAIATALGGWAAFEVSGLVRERDGLAARVAQLEAVAPPRSLPPSPADAVEPDAPPPPPPDQAPPRDEAEPSVGRDPAVNTKGGGPEKAPPPPPGPATIACTLLHDRSPSRCPLPLTYFNGYCRDVQNLAALCPGAPPPPAPPGPTPPPPPPPPARDCQSVERRAIVCVPPFRRTPVPGVCLDGNNRPMRCPPGAPRAQEPASDPNREQQQPPAPTRR